MKNIRVGDLVEEVGTDSGVWVVTEVFRNTGLRQAFAAKLILLDRPDCVTYCEVDRLQVVQSHR